MTCEDRGLYHGRSCAKHPNPKAGEWWRPLYGTKDKPILINELRSAECPVTAIKPGIERVMTLVLKAKMAQKATGASLYGTNLSLYPAWLFDACVVIEAAINMADRAASEL